MSSTETAVPKPSLPEAATVAGRRRSLYSGAVISFSLTFFGVGLAALAGYLPARHVLMSGSIDPEVVLLFVPLAALVFAIVAEALRIAVTTPRRPGAGRRARPLSEWTPGHGEG